MDDVAAQTGAATMPEDLPDTEKKKRKESRETRRVQLIEATIRVLATEGYSRTTLTGVARAAGVSHGLVNFHFESKEKLLAETLAFLADEYRDNWIRALEGAPASAAAKVNALLYADFEPKICTRDRLSAWCAFWGEAQSRPIYQASCASNDEEYANVVETYCAALIAEGSYAVDPALASRVLRVTSEGVWLEMITMSTPYSVKEAFRTVLTCAAALFPRHFDSRGLIEGSTRTGRDP